MVLEQLDITMPTNEPQLQPQPHTFCENELKIHHSPKGKINAALLLQENIGENLCDLELGRVFRCDAKSVAHKRKKLTKWAL